MKSQITGLRVASGIFLLVAVVHLIRWVFGWTVQLGSHPIGMWDSIVAALVSGGLGLWLGSLACCHKADRQEAAPDQP
jgi:hypothetical protein